MKIQDLNTKILFEVEKFQNVLGKENGSMTYLSLLDELVPMDTLMFVGGRPRTGKTSLILDFVARNSLVPRPENDAFFNELMSRKGLVFIIGHKEELIYRRWFSIINRSTVSKKESEAGLYYMKDTYLKSVEGARIDFNFLQDSDDLYANVAEKIEEEDPDYVLIDSLPYSAPFEEYYELGYSNNTELMKQLIDLQKTSKKFFLITSDLGHDAWGRSGDKRPCLEDLHSTYIDERSDLVFMLHRPELYGIVADEEGNSMKGIIEVKCVLNRYGDEGIRSLWAMERGIPQKLDAKQLCDYF